MSALGPFAPPPADTHPPLDAPAYRSTALRHPTQPVVRLAGGLTDPTELTGPVFDDAGVSDDLTHGPGGEAVGQRIIVTGRLLDGAGRPIPRSLIELWQANASGRYRHQGDQWPGTLDPNFTGAGRTLTDDDGCYRFTTIRPGAYPWGNHHNAWRPAHLHLSVFGWAFTQRLVTQMYFPDDPLCALDPILGAVPVAARPRLVAAYDHDVTTPAWALGYRWDIVVRGPAATPFEDPDAVSETPAQTVGPFLHLALADPALRDPVDGDVTIHGRLLDGGGAPVTDAVVETWQWDGPFTRCATGPDGAWTIVTRRPPPVSTVDGTPQAPHLVLSVFARGLLDRVVTRLYFDGEPANRGDPALTVAGDRAGRLVALADGPASYRFDIHLQGPDESVFFAV